MIPPIVSHDVCRAVSDNVLTSVLSALDNNSTSIIEGSSHFIYLGTSGSPDVLFRACLGYF